MNSAQILGYPLLPIAALELFLGLLLLKQNARNSAVSKATAACAFSAALWSLSAALMYLRASLGLDYLFFARANWIGWFTVPTALQTVLFLKDEHSRKARVAGKVLYPFWAVVLGLCLFTDLIVTDGYVPIPYRNSPGPLEMPIRLIGGLLVFWLIYEIIRLRSRTTGYRRSQLNFYLYGTIIFGTGGAVIGGFVQLFTGHAIEPSLSAYFSFPWVLMIFYAITRYRLFDIRIVISRTLNILFLSFCISAFQFGLFKILEPVVGGVASIFISVPIIGVIFFATPLSRNVQQWINDLVLGGRYKYQRMLRESSNAMITILNRDELLRFVIESVRSGLGISDACLYLRGGNGRYSVQYCFGSFQTGQGGSPLPERVIERLARTQQILIQDELAASPAAADDRALAASMREMYSELIIPLISKGQLLGIVTLGARGNGESYLQSDIDVLQTLAGHAAVAIENALLFEEAKQVKASLKQSEETFRALAETLPAAIFIHQGRNFLYANPAAESIAGYHLEDYKTMEFLDIVHPDYRAAVRARAAARLSGKDAPQQYDLKIVRKDGEERWVLLSAGIVEYGGKPAVIGTIFDITDRKKAEEDRERYYRERIAEQERLAAVLESTSDGFFIAGSNMRFTYVNEAYCRMSGYSLEELQAITVTDIDSEMSTEDILRMQQLVHTQGRAFFETRHRRKDGSEYHVEVSVNRFPDGKSHFTFIRDISDRKRAVESLRLSEERFRQVSETAQEWIWEVDREGRYTYASPVVTTLLGYRPEEVVGWRFFFDFFVPDEREQLKETAFRVFSAKAQFKDFVNRNLHKDGREVILSTSGIPMLDNAGNLVGYRGVDFDITERIRAERERSRLYEESVKHYQALLDEQRSHQEEKEKILKDLHDGIGGLTTNINLLAELAQKGDDLSAIKRSLAMISELSRESLSEIRGFIQSLDTKELSWHTIAAELRYLGNTIIEPHGIRFTIDTQVPEREDAPGSAVSMNLFRIYKESLSNIIKHAKATAVDVSFVVEGNKRIVLDVRDDGIGLDGKRGSGRGLTNMRTRAGEIGGTLSITSEKGTRIRLEVPIP